MNEHAIRRLLEGGGAGGKALRALLYIPGKAYGLAMRLRRVLYEKGIFASNAAGLPVISIGNITAGGSGKTPLTALLAKHFLAKGNTPAILLRGYRAAEVGASDEAVLYKTLCPGALVEVGADRAASAARAAARGADILLMDDGFQHLRLRRNLDIVLIDAAAPWGGENCIPGGLLREPLSALARADVMLVTRSDQVAPDVLAGITARLENLAPKADLFTARHAPVRLRDAGTGAALPLEGLRGAEVRMVALSGIARPEAFVKTLRSLGAEVCGVFTGNDHRPFSAELLRGAAACAEANGAVVVTTEKDAARGVLFRDYPVQVWVLGVEQEIEGGERLLERAEKILFP